MSGSGTNEVVEFWKRQIVETMQGCLDRGREPGSVDDVIEAARQLRGEFEAAMTKLKAS